MSPADDRLAERRAALRRAVSDLGEVTTRFRSRLAESGHQVPPAPASPPIQPAAPPAAPPPVLNGSGASPLSPTRAEPPPAPGAGGPDGGPLAQRDRAMAEARERFVSVSRQADVLVRTITEAVQSETRAFRANIEASAESRWREVEIEAQGRLRRAQTEADALVDERRRRIAEISGRILELGETLAGRLAEADEVKEQFDAFVESLSQASDRLARESTSGEATVTEISGAAAETTAGGLAEAA